MITLDSCDKLQMAIDAVPSWGREVIQLPEGDNHFTTPISIIDKGIVLQGGARTNLIFPGTGIIIDTTWSGAGRVHLNDLNIICANKAALTNGVEIHAITSMKNCEIRNFGGAGVYIDADIAVHHRNASHSKFDTVISEQNGTGFFMKGGDANQMCFFVCDARDNDGWGFDDESFLGCQFFGCMAHANKAGHYKTGDANNRSSFFGCYGEGDSPPNFAMAKTTFIGGLLGNSFKLDTNTSVISGRDVTSLRFGTALELNGEGMTFPCINASFPMSLKRVSEDLLPHFAFADYWGNHHEFFSASSTWNANYAGRKITFSSDGFKSFFVGSRLFAEAKPDDPCFAGFVFKPGDTLLNPDYDGSDISIREWVYKKNGWVANY